MTLRVYEYSCGVLVAVSTAIVDEADYDSYKAKLEADNNEDFYVEIEIV